MGGAVSLRLFRLPSFRALWIGQLISIFGDRFTYLALLALVVERAADPGNPAPELAWIPVASFLPAILFGPWIGALVDGWNTRTTLLVSDAVRGIVVLAMIPAAERYGLPAAFALVFLLYFVNAFFLPARSAILPELVPRESLIEANSLATLAGVIATIAGSFLAGALIERSGWRVGFALDALTYFLSVAALAFIRLEPRPRLEPRSAGGPAQIYGALARDVREGARIAFSSPRVLGSIGTVTLLWVAGGALHISLPMVIARRSVGVISGLGAALGFAAAGMVVGTLFLAWRGRRGSPRARIEVGLAGAGLALFSFAVLTQPAALATAAFVAGIFIAFLLVTTESAIQESVGPEARARVFALRDFLARAGVLVSAGLLGALLQRGWLSPSATVGTAGAILLVSGICGGLAGWMRGRRPGSAAPSS
jgi:MFS family permease